MFSDHDDVLAWVRANEIGRGSAVDTPFGRRLLYYADQTASGRFLGMVERWLARVRPYYANSHTVISTTGSMMTRLREEARAIVRRAVNAGDDDVALFVGSGATACINKLVGLLGLTRPSVEWTGFHPESLGRRRPVVLVGPYEHHSNELPWAESIAEVWPVEESPRGDIDLADLEEKLRAAADRPLVIGSFSAASNVTGILTDVAAVARLCHRHGALAFFDYAAAAPYVPIDMRPADAEARLDAVFVSTHKFAGGPQASGVMVLNRACFRRDVPERPGGGTVDYVSYFGKHHVDYSRRLEEREEGGTPAIIGDVRAGAAFLVRELMQPARMYAHEVALARSAVERLARHPRIRVLGPPDLPRLAILSFTIEGLHHDFVATLLDHLFGIQNRAGCACAGPYGHRLLGVSADRSGAFRRQILRGVLGIKPGWTRVTLPVYATPEDIEYLLGAIEFVADHGEAFLPLYELGWRDGVWTHREWRPPAPHLELSVESLKDAGREAHELGEADIRAAQTQTFAEARALAARLRERPLEEWPTTTGDAELDALVWFRYAHARPAPADAERLPPPLASE
jgi:selenocysteine lyase/cysteine desulfurase